MIIHMRGRLRSTFENYRKSESEGVWNFRKRVTGRVLVLYYIMFENIENVALQCAK